VIFVLTCSEVLPTTFVEYHQLSCSRLRNPNVSTEIQGGIRTGVTDSSVSPRYAVATLDGTLLLVQDETVLWYVICSNTVGSCTFNVHS
jgi:hypothetical protein